MNDSIKKKAVFLHVEQGAACLCDFFFSSECNMFLP